MKSILFSVPFLLLSSVVFSGSRTEKPTKWKLTLHEKFNGTTLDTTKWSKIPRGTADWNRHMTDNDSCYKIENGKLILRGINNTVARTDTAKFLTGGVYTKGKATVEHGKIEVCARLQSAQGAWPAIWMLAEKDKYGAYPKNGEIDIMEHLNYDSLIYQTVHSYYTLALNEKEHPPHHTTVSFDPGQYNVFGVEIHPDKLVFTLNGKETFVYPRIETDKEGQFPFDQPYYLLIDQQLGGSWVGKVDPQTLPVEMSIDWVKMYIAK